MKESKKKETIQYMQKAIKLNNGLFSTLQLF